MFVILTLCLPCDDACVVNIDGSLIIGETRDRSVLCALVRHSYRLLVANVVVSGSDI